MNFDDVGCFSSLLLALDEAQDRLGVMDYSLGMSSLEDVFMALGSPENKDENQTKSGEGAEQIETLPADQSLTRAREVSGWRSAKAVFALRLKPFQSSRQRLLTILLVPLLMQLGGTYLAGLGAQEDNSGANGYAVCIYPTMAFGIALLSSSQDIMTDIKNKCKYVSMSQGLTARAYWQGNFMAHLVLLLPTAVEFVIVFLIFRPPSIPTEAIPLVVLTILLYPVPLICCVYNFAAALAGSESISKVVPTLLMTTQLLPGLLMWVLTAPFIQSSTIRDAAVATHIVLAVVNPNYALPGMMAYLVNIDGPKRLPVGEYFLSLSAIPLYTIVLTSGVCILNLVRLDARLGRDGLEKSSWLA